MGSYYRSLGGNNGCTPHEAQTYHRDALYSSQHHGGFRPVIGAIGRASRARSAARGDGNNVRQTADSKRSKHACDVASGYLAWESNKRAHSGRRSNHKPHHSSYAIYHHSLFELPVERKGGDLTSVLLLLTPTCAIQQSHKMKRGSQNWKAPG